MEWTSCHCASAGASVTHATRAFRQLLPVFMRMRLLHRNGAGEVPAPSASATAWRTRATRFALPLPAVAIPGLLLFQYRRDERFISDSRRVTWTGAAIDDLDWTIDR